MSLIVTIMFLFGTNNKDKGINKVNYLSTVSSLGRVLRYNNSLLDRLFELI